MKMDAGTRANIRQAEDSIRTKRRSKTTRESKPDTAITSLALLAFLGAGHTHQDGPYKINVQYGLEFLLRSQSRGSGSLAGRRDFARTNVLPRYFNACT